MAKAKIDQVTGMLEKIHIEGFRRLADVELNFKPLNVLIGANGSGKTSLVDVFSLLAESASGRLSRSIGELGGIVANLTDLQTGEREKASSMAFRLTTTSETASPPLNYRIRLASQGIGYRIKSEELASEASETLFHASNGIGKFLNKPNGCWDNSDEIPGFDEAESALSQAPKIQKETDAFRRRLASSTSYQVFDMGKRSPIRLPQPMRAANLPGVVGENLVSCLYMMRETDPDRFETLEATLQAVFPSFERLNFPPVAAGTLAMTWKDRNSKNPFYVHQLSEGTLRFLWLTTLLQCSGLTAITMIDEPEVSLHPELLSIVADMLREASAKTQLIVATHSDLLIRFLKPSEVIAVSLNDDGAAELKRADEFDLDGWLKEYNLDEVWRMGRLGARP